LSYTDLLINECTIKWFNNTGTDAYGNPTGTWDDRLVDEPCRLIAGAGREIKVGAEVVIADYKLFLEEDVVITERDRVIIDLITYEVLLVADRQNGMGNHHKECFMQVVR